MSARRPVRGIPGAAGLGAGAAVCGVALTATSGWLIVAASYRPQILTLIAVIVLVRAFGIARPAFRYAERLRSHDAALAHLAGARADTYARLVPLTPARLGRRSRGDVLAGVVDDLDDLSFAQVRVVVPLAATVITGLLAAGAVSLVFIPAALAVVSLIVCCGLVGALDAAIEARTSRAVVAARADVTRLATLVADAGPALAAIGGTRDALAWCAAAQRDLDRAITRASWGRAVGVGGVPVVTAAHLALTVHLLTPWLGRGLSAPVAAFVVLVPVALAEVVGVVPDAVGALVRARAARARLDDLLGQTPAVADAAGAPDDEPGPTPDAAAPRLDLAGLTARWEADRDVALGPLDLGIAPGEFLAVVGPNGCGKSTLLAVLARHLDPAGGRYALDGTDVLDVAADAVRARMAVVDDDPHVFASTVRENLRLARPAAGDDDLRLALDRAGLRAWFDGLPRGLDELLGADGRGVSGGERARLSIARALLSARPVLLLDEPVAHLDRPTALAVLADVAAASRGRTVVLVAHRDEGVEHAERVLDLAPPPPGGPTGAACAMR